MASNEFMTVEVQGLSQLQENMEALPQKVAKKGLRSALKKGGIVFINAMVALAPKDTGFLAQHFNMRMKIMHDDLAGSVFIGPQGKVDYPAYASGAYNIKRRKSGKIAKFGRVAVATVARFLEFGTSKMAKKPFMTQAFESFKDRVVQVVADVLKEVFED